MRKIVASVFITLDGVAEAPGGGDVSLPELSGWSDPFMTEEMGQLIMRQMDATDALLMGRTTYQEFAAFWPNVPDDDPFGKRMNGMKKYVISSTLDTVTWQNSVLINKNIPEEIAKLKAQDGGNLSITGSLGLIRSLINYNLLDELQLAVCPVILGAGKRLFDGVNTKKVLKFVDSTLYSTGMALMVYQPQNA